MDIPAILNAKFPESNWTLDGDDYEGLIWSSDSKKPTKEILEKLWPEIKLLLEKDLQKKSDTKESAIAKLTKLGLTSAEIEALKS
jgi:hypothetical protein